MAEIEHFETRYFWLPPRASPLARSIFATIGKGKQDALGEIDLLIAAKLKPGPKPVLVGVAGTGWTFHFLGYRKAKQVRAAGLRQPITSADDWRRVLKRGFIFNDASEVFSQKQFLERGARQQSALCKGKLPKNPTVAFQKARNRDLRAQALSSCWIDAEGHAFCDESW